MLVSHSLGTSALFDVFGTHKTGYIPLSIQGSIHVFLVWNSWDRTIIMRFCPAWFDDPDADDSLDDDEDETIQAAAEVPHIQDFGDTQSSSYVALTTR